MIFIAITNLMVIMVGLVFAAALVRETTIQAVERGSYWSSKKEKPSHPRVKEQSRAGIIKQMGFSGRGVPIRTRKRARTVLAVQNNDEPVLLPSTWDKKMHARITSHTIEAAYIKAPFAFEDEGCASCEM